MKHPLSLKGLLLVPAVIVVAACSTPSTSFTPIPDKVGELPATPLSPPSRQEELNILAEQSNSIIASARKFKTDTNTVATLNDGNLIAPGDQLTVQIWLRDKITQFRGYPFQQTIPTSGEIFLPDVGAVTVTGKTMQELKELISAHFTRILKEPTIMLYRNARQESALSPNTPLSQTADRRAALLIPHIIIMGRIASPGIYPLESGLTIRDALAQAGPPAEYAELKKVYIVRGSRTSPEIVRVNLINILTGRDLSQNYLLQPNDAIYVAPYRMWNVYDYIRTILLPITAVRDAAWVGSSGFTK